MVSVFPGDTILVISCSINFERHPGHQPWRGISQVPPWAIMGLIEQSITEFQLIVFPATFKLWVIGPPFCSNSPSEPWPVMVDRNLNDFADVDKGTSTGANTLLFNMLLIPGPPNRAPPCHNWFIDKTGLTGLPTINKNSISICSWFCPPMVTISRFFPFNKGAKSVISKYQLFPAIPKSKLIPYGVTKDINSLYQGNRSE